MSQNRQKAFTELYNNYKNPIYGFILNRVSLKEDIAEELTGDVFVNAYEKFDEQRDTYASWLYTIARNKIIDYSRKNKDLPKEQSDLDKIYDSDSLEIIDEIDRMRLKDDLLNKLEILNEKQKKCITLFYLKDLSAHEIGAQLGIRRDAVRQHVSRGLKKLRRNWVTETYYETT